MGSCFSKANTTHVYGYNSCCKDQNFMNSCCNMKSQTSTDPTKQASVPSSIRKDESHESCTKQKMEPSQMQNRNTPSLIIAAEKLKKTSSDVKPPSSSTQKVEPICVDVDQTANVGSLQHCSRKNSGELAIANTGMKKMIKASSPRKNPLLHSLLPPAPSAIVTKTVSSRSTASLQRSNDTSFGEGGEEEVDDDEEEYEDEKDLKFRPSEARKQWLSEMQTLVLPGGNKDQNRETLSRGKTVSSRTNSFSRLPDPVTEDSLKNSMKASGSVRSATNNSGPLLLRRSPSINASACGDGEGGGPCLCRNASGKIHVCPEYNSSNVNESSHGSSDLHTLSVQKPRSLIAHKNGHSLNTEHASLDASDSALFVHKRSSSRDSGPITSREFHMDSHATNNIRRPSPPKKTTPLSLSSSDANRQMTSSSSRRPVASSIKADQSSSLTHKPVISQEHASNNPGARSGIRTAVQKSSGQIELEISNMTSSGNKTVIRKEKSPLKRKEKSPLRRTCINGAMPTSNNTCLSTTPKMINADRNATGLSVDDLKSKDSSTRTKRSTTRLPLKEMSNNSTNHAHVKPSFSKHTVKENASMQVKVSDEKAQILTDTSNGEVMSPVKANTGSIDHEANVKTAVLDLEQDFVVASKDPIEVKAESLVMGGKSVLSAFRALEEYRLKYSNLNLDPHEGESCDDDVLYSRHHRPHTREKESFSQPLSQSGSALERGVHENIPEYDDEQARDEVLLTRSRSTNKRSCEPFLFPDVQSLLLMQENLDSNEGSNMEGGGAVRVTMPASISKACSILKAVADLNMGVLYPQRKDRSNVEENYIERPNLSSFQFGDGDSHRVTTG